MAIKRKTNTATKSKAAATTRTKKAPRKPTRKAVIPSYEAIAERAWCIWKDNGCQHGQDEHNWFEAATQLKAEQVSC